MPLIVCSFFKKSVVYYRRLAIKQSGVLMAKTLVKGEVIAGNYWPENTLLIIK